MIGPYRRAVTKARGPGTGLCRPSASLRVKLALACHSVAAAKPQLLVTTEKSAWAPGVQWDSDMIMMPVDAARRSGARAAGDSSSSRI
jgi:hypothetical protein